MAANLGFLGSGAMAFAMARGISRTKQFDQLYFSDVNKENLAKVRQFGQTTTENAEVAQHCSLLIIAVKPQFVGEVAKAILGRLTEDHLIVSIAAGVTLARLRKFFGPKPRLIRVMPNTPMMIGKGASAICGDASATHDDRRLVFKMLSSLGLCVEVPENLFDAVTGLSASGPAFCAIFTEALADGGVAAGLPRHLSLQLAAQTVAGSGAMLVPPPPTASGDNQQGTHQPHRASLHPAELKDMVCSPAGTTIAGVAALEERGLRAATIQAVVAASRRAKELSKL